MNLFTHLKNSPVLITTTSIIDNAAWIFYAFATTFISISIATTISESYIALTVLLGIFVNKERVKWHQVVGIVVTVLAVLMLSAISE